MQDDVRAGPAGTRRSSTVVTDSVSPIARVVPSVAGNGPALRPPGPDRSCSVPLMSSARPPVLRTIATTIGRPSGERTAVKESIAKLDAGAPQGPTEM